MNRIFILLTAIILFFQACSAQVSTKAPQSIPEFTFYTLKGNQAVARTSLAIRGNLVFIFFDPGCSHCRTDIKAIGDNFEKVKDANFYLVSQQDPALVNEFMNIYGKGLQNKTNVQVLLDRNFEFLEKFYPTQYPAMYVYGQDRKLKSFHEGARPVDQIIKAINN